MTETRETQCAACGLPPYPPDRPIDAASGLPTGWVDRRIGSRQYLLCECCGDIRHFKGGISPYLQEHLGVGPNAQCQFGEQPGSGLHKSRVRSG